MLIFAGFVCMAANVTFISQHIINFKQKRGHSELKNFSGINTLQGAPSNPKSLKLILEFKEGVVHVYSIYI